MKQSRDNRRRANKVEQIILAVRCEMATQEDCSLRLVRRDDALVDLLANIRHYCDQRGLEFHSLDRLAYNHYSGERGENK